MRRGYMLPSTLSQRYESNPTSFPDQIVDASITSPSVSQWRRAEVFLLRSGLDACAKKSPNPGSAWTSGHVRLWLRLISVLGSDARLWGWTAVVIKSGLGTQTAVVGGVVLIPLLRSLR